MYIYIKYPFFNNVDSMLCKILEKNSQYFLLSTFFFFIKISYENRWIMEIDIIIYI